MVVYITEKSMWAGPTRGLWFFVRGACGRDPPGGGKRLKKTWASLYKSWCLIKFDQFEHPSFLWIPQRRYLISVGNTSTQNYEVRLSYTTIHRSVRQRRLIPISPVLLTMSELQQGHSTHLIPEQQQRGWQTTQTISLIRLVRRLLFRDQYPCIETN